MDQSIRQFLRYIEFSRRYSPNTITAYRTDLLQFRSFAGKPLIRAQQSDIRAFITKLKKAKFSHRTINRKIEVIKSFYRFAVKHGQITISPARHIQLLMFHSPKGKFIPSPILSEILDQIPVGHCKITTRDRLLLELLYYTGCRVSEVINLKRSEIDFCRMQMKVTGKGRYQRVVVINKKIVELITIYESLWNSKSSYLLVSNKGRKIYPMLVWRIIQQYFRQPHVDFNVSAHVIRHSIATHLYRDRAPLHSIKSFLGHKSLRTTLLYIHSDPSHLKKVFQLAHPKA